MTSATTRGALDKALALADYKGVGGAQGGVGRQGQAARRRLLRLYRGLRHRAVGGGRLARRGRRPVGIGRGAGQPDRHRRGPDRLAQPRPGPRDDLRAARLRRVSAFRSRTSRSSTATPTRCRWAWAPTARAPARSACRRSSRRSTRSRPRRRRSPAMCSKPPNGDIEFKDGKFTVKGTDKSIDFGSVALNAYIAHKFNGQELEPGLKESAFWDPTNFTFPAGVHICELEIDPETGVVDDRPLDRGRRLRQADQSDDRRGPGARRHRAGHRPGAARGRASTTSDGQLLTASYMDYCMPRADNLPSFTRRHDRDGLPVQSARHQGLRRGRRDRLAARGHQRDHRRARPRGRGDAGDRRRSSGAPRRRPRLKRAAE